MNCTFFRLYALRICRSLLFRFASTFSANSLTYRQYLQRRTATVRGHHGGGLWVQLLQEVGLFHPVPTRAPLLTRGTHRYKAGTAEFTSWLADAANTGGVDLKDIILPAPTGNSERKKTPRRQQLSTQNIYFISIRHFPDLAQTVANFENRRIIVPRGIYNLLSDIIALRKAVSEMWIQGAFGPSSSGGDDRHVCFINILKKVKEILKGRVEKTVVDTKFPAPNYELGNFFAALNVEEPQAGYSICGRTCEAISEKARGEVRARA